MLINCNDTTPYNNISALYYCTLKSPLSYNDGSTVIFLQWVVSSQLRGDEGHIPVNISLVVPNQEDSYKTDFLLHPIAVASHSIFL